MKETLKDPQRIQFELLEVVRRNKLSGLKALVKNGANIFIKDEGNATLLHIAAKYGYSEILEYLLLQGADVNAEDKKGMKPLDYAVLKYFIKPEKVDWTTQPEQKERYDTLFDSNVKLEQARLKLYIQSQNKALSNNVDDINILINAGGQLRLIDESVYTRNPVLLNIRENTHLNEALALNDGVKFREFINSHPKEEIRKLINKPDFKGNTMIFYAIQKNSQEMVADLISAGADLNVVNKKGETPLYSAVRTASYNIVKKIIYENKVDLNSRVDGNTMLHYAMQRVTKTGLLERKTIGLLHVFC